VQEIRQIIRGDSYATEEEEYVIKDEVDPIEEPGEEQSEVWARDPEQAEQVLRNRGEL
jgi:hypothetical protein